MPTTTTTLWPVPTQLLSSAAAILQQHGISSEQLLAASNITEAMLATPELLLPYRSVQQILQRAIELSPIAHLGLAIGAAQTPGSMGVLGFGINSCATVEDAMNMVVKYFRVSSTLLQAQWQLDDDRLRWISTPPIDLGSILPCVVEEEFSIMLRNHQLLTGQELHIIEAHFQYPQPDYVERYRQLFNCPLIFNTEHNQLIMPASILQQPILQANALMALAAERLCDEFLSNNPTTDDFIIRLRAEVVDRQGQFLDEPAIAAVLNITPRTLRNRLRRLGTHYQQIIDDYKRQIAEKDLRLSSITVGDIAEQLGYSDARSFRRAFKKWTGMTPIAFRKLKS